MDAPDTSRPTPTPIPKFKKPTIRKASISKSGVLELSFSSANDQAGSCAVSLAVSTRSGAAFKRVKSLTSTSTTYTTKLNSSGIKNGPLKRVYIKLTKTCPYGSGATTGQLTFKQSAKGKITSLARLIAHLKRLP
jgi:hypothetical protein